MITAASVETMIRAMPDAVEVWQDGATSWGLVDQVQEEALASDGAVVVVGTRTELLLATGILPALARDSYLKVGTTAAGSAAKGTRYRARDIRRDADGLETVVWLAEAD